MKKIICFLMIGFNFIGSICIHAANDEYLVKEEKEIWYNTKFVVSAYYSPLPDQSIYFRGNFEADKRLNGDGVYAANGKKVFPGLLAAPKTYTFGTQIELEGLGIGIVGDRGGAIVKAGVRENPYDRIDIWVGSGEEGLKKALTFGMRIVNGRILKKDEQSQNKNISLDVFQIGKYDFTKYKTQNSIFLTAVGENSSPETIKKLQEILKQLKKYNGEIDGKYSEELENAILEFQLEHNIIKDKEEAGAGYFGPQTREKLKTVYLSSGSKTTTPTNIKTTQKKKENISTKNNINKKNKIKEEIDGILGSLGNKK